MSEREDGVCAMTTPNAELAYRVLDYITEFPEQHDQSTYVAKLDGDVQPGPDCGTIACFAGWTCFLSGDKPAAGWPSIVRVGDRSVHVHERAQQFLRLNSSQADRLFIETQREGEIPLVIAEIFGPRPGERREAAA